MKNGRRWLFFGIILLVVAVILTFVFINLFRDKETIDLAKDVNKVAQTGYLNKESEEYETINDYFDYLLTQFTDEAEKIEVQNYKKSYDAFVIAGEFFNRQIVFTTYKPAYKNNWKAIQKALTTAQESADKFKAYIDEKTTYCRKSLLEHKHMGFWK